MPSIDAKLWKQWPFSVIKQLLAGHHCLFTRLLRSSNYYFFLNWEMDVKINQHRLIFSLIMDTPVTAPCPLYHEAPVPVPLMIFRSNSKFECSSLKYGWPITTKFAHVTTVYLSWRVPNYVMISRAYFKREHFGRIWNSIEISPAGRALWVPLWVSLPIKCD